MPIAFFWPMCPLSRACCLTPQTHHPRPPAPGSTLAIWTSLVGRGRWRHVTLGLHGNPPFPVASWLNETARTEQSRYRYRGTRTHCHWHWVTLRTRCIPLGHAGTLTVLKSELPMKVKFGYELSIFFFLERSLRMRDFSNHLLVPKTSENP